MNMPEQETETKPAKVRDDAFIVRAMCGCSVVSSERLVAEMTDEEKVTLRESYQKAGGRGVVAKIRSRIARENRKSARSMDAADDEVVDDEVVDDGTDTIEE